MATTEKPDLTPAGIEKRRNAQKGGIPGLGIMILVGFIALIVFACSGAFSDDTPTTSTGAPRAAAQPATASKPISKPEAERDGGAQLSCTHFRNVAADWSILDATEQRTKLQEIYAKARTSSDTTIREAGRAMLEHFTAGNYSDGAAAISQFSNACNRLGY